jgi:hypothetical protein
MLHHKRLQPVTNGYGANYLILRNDTEVLPRLFAGRFSNAAQRFPSVSARASREPQWWAVQGLNL